MPRPRRREPKRTPEDIEKQVAAEYAYVCSLMSQQEMEERLANCRSAVMIGSGPNYAPPVPGAHLRFLTAEDSTPDNTPDTTPVKRAKPSLVQNERTDNDVWFASCYSLLWQFDKRAEFIVI